MDWSQIVTLVSNTVLPVFTGGLVWATIALWRSTSRYADATEKLVQATELSTEAARDMAQSMERSTEISKLEFVDGIFRNIYQGTTELGQQYKNVLLAIGEEKDQVSTVPVGEKAKAMSDKLSTVHRELVGKLLEELQVK